ncbi:hypothetical protein C5167_039882 [Papaver somniferum]|uniref:Uncharacterized protein n=1 Tax=Papaver somniferum TaxID=3469 RepID=A0A4Y7IDL4_PAPSO|nr:glucan 1,3-beta-glucosidase A-like [Papaver somniferum]XP_026437041.1 glucan 1,3-beta-glucosidase A-like [Papaver somniferum]RZC46934.1 hypothetical protein C5167_039882 [Papaver somniferum]
MYLVFTRIFLMDSVSCKWLLLSFFCLSWANSASCAVDGVYGGKVRGVNLGNWLVVEGWMKPSLFDGIPNGDMLDGAKVHFRSLRSNKYVCAEEGGDSGAVTVNREKASGWETFRLWRISQSEYQLRSFKGQFLSCAGQWASITTTSGSPSWKETFTIERSSNDRVRIKHSSGRYLQASSENELKANYVGTPDFDDGNAAIFVMTFDGGPLKGEYQLCNGHGPQKAKQVLTEHRNNYITREDFRFISKHGINTVRIPVGWWITKDPYPPAPYVGGGLAALDNAFRWAHELGLKCIIDLHAAPGSQNGMDHSSSRDGSIDWLISDNIQRSLEAIEFLASRYGYHPALLGIELLNEPHSPEVPLDKLLKYYRDGYDIVRKHSPAYVIMSQVIGPGDPADIYKANTGKSKVVLDLHYYNLYDSYFENISTQENIDFLYRNRKSQMDSLNAADGPLVFIGEWVNEFGKGGSTEDYRNFGRAQLDVYGSASFGWAYWSFKNVNNHWSFQWNINQNYLRL